MYLTGNPIVSLGRSAFINTKISNLITKQFIVCCSVRRLLKDGERTNCNAQPVWPNSCKRLLSDTTVRVFVWLISILGVLMNGSAFFVIWRKILPGGDKYNNVIICLSISDSLYCVSLLTIAVADEVIAGDYLGNDYYWRTFSVISPLYCLSLQIFFRHL